MLAKYGSTGNGLHAAMLARCRCLLKIQKYLLILLFGDTRLTKLKLGSDMSLLVTIHVHNTMLGIIIEIVIPKLRGVNPRPGILLCIYFMPIDFINSHSCSICQLVSV